MTVTGPHIRHAAALSQTLLPQILRLTPAFDFLGAVAGRVSQPIKVQYYTADRWHTRSLSVLYRGMLTLLSRFTLARAPKRSFMFLGL
jgi:hypothetical protein